MEKAAPFASLVPQQPPKKASRLHGVALFLLVAATLYWLDTHGGPFSDAGSKSYDLVCSENSSLYGHFPQTEDPFQFLPCTSDSLPPPLVDPDHKKSWAALFDPNPDYWSWGNSTANGSTAESAKHDPYAGRGIYLCGYLDVPLDYTNASDTRIARLAITKYQVSGLARADDSATANSSAGQRSARTLVVEPGGPGGSGTFYVRLAAEKLTQRFSFGEFDVLGWDPRGINPSLPAIACFPFDADRDRWALLTTQYRDTLARSPRAQLELADAMNNATFAACKEVLGDLPRFVGTAFVARDLEQIRIALGEPELTGYFVSYGTGIGQTYANMYPERIGRLILDGTEYVRDSKLLGGFGWSALDNATDAWRDGFLGECVVAGPEYCALAQPQGEGKTSVTLPDLQNRMSVLLSSLAARPIPGYTSSSGPSLVTYSSLVGIIHAVLYDPRIWYIMAQILCELEQGNATLAAWVLDLNEWEFEPPAACPVTTRSKPSSDELSAMVICADSYDAPQPPFDHKDEDDDKSGLPWWSSLWHNMTLRSWISGDPFFYDVLPCRHYTYHFGPAAEAYRGDLNNTLAHPVLLIAATHDPATPLRNARRLLDEMGNNARMIVHHGYGHSSSGDKSKCTDEIARELILHGKVPDERETACFADEKPYRYGISGATRMAEEGNNRASPLDQWREHMRELASYHPRLFSRL